MTMQMMNLIQKCKTFRDINIQVTLIKMVKKNKVKEKYGFQMVIMQKEYLKMITNKDKELIFGKIKINIQDNLKKI